MRGSLAACSVAALVHGYGWIGREMLKFNLAMQPMSTAGLKFKANDLNAHCTYKWYLYVLEKSPFSK